MVVDADFRGDHLKVGLPGLGVGGFELLLQESGKGLDVLGSAGLRGLPSSVMRLSDALRLMTLGYVATSQSVSSSRMAVTPEHSPHL